MENKEITLPGIFSQGYGVVPKTLMKAKDLSSNSKLILCYLLSYTGAGVTCFPNMENIAEDLSISKRTVVRCVKQMLDNKYINIHKKHLGRGKGSSNLYEIMFMHEYASAKKSPTKQKASDKPIVASDNKVPMQVTPENRNINSNNNIYNNNNSADNPLFLLLYEHRKTNNVLPINPKESVIFYKHIKKECSALFSADPGCIKVFKWATNDNFWKTHLLRPEQYNQLKLQYTKNQPKSMNGQANPQNNQSMAALYSPAENRPVHGTQPRGI